MRDGAREHAGLKVSGGIRHKCVQGYTPVESDVREAAARQRKGEIPRIDGRQPHACGRLPRARIRWDASGDAQIDERATTEELNTAVSGLTAQIDERVTETELTDVVNGLNIAIDQRITQAQLNAGMDNATNNAINTTLPQTSAKASW